MTRLDGFTMLTVAGELFNFRIINVFARFNNAFHRVWNSIWPQLKNSNSVTENQWFVQITTTLKNPSYRPPELTNPLKFLQS